MDNFFEYDRNIIWEFYGNTIPEGITPKNNNDGSITPRGIEKGGIGNVRLEAPNRGDSNQLDTVYFTPTDFDEVRFKTLLYKNTTSRFHSVRVGLYSENDNDGIYFGHLFLPSLKRAGTEYKVVDQDLGYGKVPLPFEIVWYPKQNEIKFYMDNRLISISKTDNPPTNKRYRGSIMNINDENPNIDSKILDVYTIQLHLIVYSK